MTVVRRVGAQTCFASAGLFSLRRIGSFIKGSKFMLRLIGNYCMTPGLRVNISASVCVLYQFANNLGF